ncbi:MAG: LysR family transcriptional regulator [Burkholderiales bacterium]|mgnify:CR=1 FL=1
MDRLEELALFLAILEGGSLASAARKTFRSPAAVTRILSEMESRLGMRLIVRTTRKLAATEAGQCLAGHARQLLSNYENAMHDACGSARQPQGLLRISAPLVFGRRHLAPLVGEFLQAYPQVKAELLLSNSMVNLLEQQIDVALRIGLLPDSSLVAKPVGQVRRVIVASPDYLARYGLPLSVSDLSRHQAILQSSDGSWPEWRFAMPDASLVNIRPPARWVVNQAETAIEAACKGQGVIRALSYQVSDEIASGALVRLLPEFEPPPLPVSLVFTETRFMAMCTRVFLDFAVPRLKRLKVLDSESSA